MRTQGRSERSSIASYVEPRTFASGTRAALQGLGYSLVPAFSMGRFDDASWRPTLRLVDERHYDRIPGIEQDPDTPVVLVTGARPRRIEDPRVAGSVRRPLDLESLYPVLQRALERTPRAAPRVSTRLSARAMREDRRWVGSLTSLSTGGCFFRSRRPTPLGARLCVQFALPRGGIVTARAVCIHVGDEGIGLAFTDTSPEARRDIGGFVNNRLATV
jgi:hypothetical protein